MTDRVIHDFYGLRRKDKRLAIQFDPARVVKKTIEIETK